MRPIQFAALLLVACRRADDSPVDTADTSPIETGAEDADEDGVPDAEDNCPDDANTDQADLDTDSLGDVCDADRDGDGTDDAQDAFPDDADESKDSDSDGVGDNADAFPNDATESVDTDSDGVGDGKDNCTIVANPDQEDSDADGSGDDCDGDRDGDGVVDEDDAFPGDPTETTDTDADGVGDNADAFPNDATESVDDDADGTGDNSDNCLDLANDDQLDLDDDGEGDPCDDDRDGDGTANASDAFPDDALESVDSDNDGTGDNADAFPNDATESADTDADGVGDGKDNCGAVGNPGQQNLDGDAFGDACDDDRDGDGTANGTDAFPDDADEDTDSDGDGTGDNADAFPNDPTESTDTDDDGVGDNGDNCPTVSNDQADLDGDTAGDACDTDVDGDGTAATDDCDDRDATRSLTASEVCDGVDQDCDGTPDDGVLLSWYRDADNDTYGNAADVTTACTQPSGRVANATDCNDGAGGVFPGATETYDGVDQDCDGTPDDGATAASCNAIKTVLPSATSGTYGLDPDGAGSGAPYNAYCDMTTSGGGWTLVLRVVGTDTSNLLYNTWVSTSTLGATTDFSLTSGGDTLFPSYANVSGNELMFYDSVACGSDRRLAQTGSILGNRSVRAYLAALTPMAAEYYTCSSSTCNPANPNFVVPVYRNTGCTHPLNPTGTQFPNGVIGINYHTNSNYQRFGFSSVDWDTGFGSAAVPDTSYNSGDMDQIGDGHSGYSGHVVTLFVR